MSILRLSYDRVPYFVLAISSPSVIDNTGRVFHLSPTL